MGLMPRVVEIGIDDPAADEDKKQHISMVQPRSNPMRQGPATAAGAASLSSASLSSASLSPWALKSSGLDGATKLLGPSKRRATATNQFLASKAPLGSMPGGSSRQPTPVVMGISEGGEKAGAAHALAGAGTSSSKGNHMPEKRGVSFAPEGLTDALGLGQDKNFRKCLQTCRTKDDEKTLARLAVTGTTRHGMEGFGAILEGGGAEAVAGAAGGGAGGVVGGAGGAGAPQTEVVEFSCMAFKVRDTDGKKEKRVLAVTNLAIYNMKPGKYKKFQRRLLIEKVGSLLLSTENEQEFVVHFDVNVEE